MSVLRSRAELDREPRTAQFEIRTDYDGDPREDCGLPFVVDVFWPALGQLCDAGLHRMYLATQQSVERWNRHIARLDFGVPLSRDTGVCECLGGIIE